MFLVLFINFLIHFGSKCHAITINSVGFTFYDTIQSSITEKFNKYARENNLDIELKTDLYTTENSTSLVNDFGSTIEFLLKKKSTK